MIIRDFAGGPLIFDQGSCKIIRQVEEFEIHSRVVGGKDQQTIGFKHSVELAQGWQPVSQVVQHQRRGNQVKLAVSRKAQRLTQIRNQHWSASSQPHPSCRGHFLAGVHADYPFCPMFQVMLRVPARTAARVQDGQPGQRRQLG